MTGKRNFRDWLKVLVLLLDEAVVVAGVFLVLNYFGVRIPLPLMIILAVPLAVFVLVMHIRIIPSFHRRQVTGREGMIGLRGEVIQPLTPKGLVSVNGERWKAEAMGGNIYKGVNVEVVEMMGLTLKVRLTED